MADGVFNIAKGKVNAYQERVANNDPANSAIVIILLKVVEADATLKAYDTLAAILAAVNTEADFTNYNRIVLTDADLSAPIPDDVNNWQNADIPDQVYVSAGGAVDNSLVKVIVCYDPDSTGGTDADLIPLTYHDYVVTTSGVDLNLNVAASGYYRAQ